MEVIIINYWYIWFIIIIVLCTIVPRNKIFLGIIKRRRKGEKSNMPTELIQEFIGKICSISLFNEISGIKGKIISVEGNWIKIMENNTSRLINGDMIRDIKLLPQKYQK